MLVESMTKGGAKKAFLVSLLMRPARLREVHEKIMEKEKTKAEKGALSGKPDKDVSGKTKGKGKGKGKKGDDDLKAKGGKKEAQHNGDNEMNLKQETKDAQRKLSKIEAWRKNRIVKSY